MFAVVSDSKPLGLLLGMLIILVGLLAVTFLIWLMQVWRRFLHRTPPQRHRFPDTDPWKTAAERLEVDETHRDEHTRSRP